MSLKISLILLSIICIINLINTNELKTIERPNSDNNKPLIINASIYIIDIGLLSPSESMNFFIDFYFRQKWQDTKLIRNNSDNIDDYIVMNDENELKKIWLPDTFIASAKILDEHLQKSFNHNNGNRFIQIHNNGDVFFSHRLMATVNCANRIKYFPLDNPICLLEFESYGYSTKDIEYNWMENDAKINSKPKSLIDFNLINTINNNNDSDSFNINVDKELIKLSNNRTYSRLIVRLSLQRKCGYYLINYYIPSILLVLISLLSLYYNINYNYNNNLIINLSTLISIIIFYKLLERQKFVLLTAINLYVFLCLLIIIIIFILIQMINFTKNYIDNREKTIGKSYELENGNIYYKHSIYRYFCIILPIIFILFNIIYLLIIYLS